MAETGTDGFWALRSGDESHLACTDGAGFTLTYGELREAVRMITGELRTMGSRQLGFIECAASPEWLICYLATLAAGHVPLLIPEGLIEALLGPLLQTYRPQWIWRSPSRQEPRSGADSVIDHAVAGFQVRADGFTPDLHPELGCLLSTSGSTGSPKLVRISYQALDVNARSIADYLGLGTNERALTTLPTSYSYGLSVVNSHLRAGATLVLRSVSPISREFVDVINSEGITSLAGVPSWYQMLLRTGFDKAETPSVHTLTQAGGRLDDRIKRAVLAMAGRKGIRFFVMYGQTEATARISYVPPETLAQHMDSIGIPIPGGKILLDPKTSEIIYQGPNVMMGYAESAGDLAMPDECHGILSTGDIGAVDDSGYFRITGRLKRVIKLSGNRFGLDEVEHNLVQLLDAPVAVTGRDEKLGVFIEGDKASLLE
ncbi:MAG: AMP-binding protein, partial [Mycobacterium sp.]